MSNFLFTRASLVAQRVKRPPAMWETKVLSLGQEDPLEKEMATHSSILAWRIPGLEEPGRLQSTGLQRVGHDSVTWLDFFLFKFKMGYKAAETTCSINNAFGQELPMNVQCSGVSRSFSKKRALKMRSVVASHQKLTSKLIFLQLQEKLPKNSTSTIL